MWKTNKKRTSVNFVCDPAHSHKLIHTPATGRVGTLVQYGIINFSSSVSWIRGSKGSTSDGYGNLITKKGDE